MNFNSVREKKRETGTPGAREASGKARQVSQTTLSPADLRVRCGSKQVKAPESVFLLPARFADTTFQHSLFSTFLL